MRRPIALKKVGERMVVKYVGSAKKQKKELREKLGLDMAEHDYEKCEEHCRFCGLTKAAHDVNEEPNESGSKSSAIE